MRKSFVIVVDFFRNISYNHNIFDCEVIQMFCPNCGHQNNDNVNFCAKCGTAFTYESPVQVVSTSDKVKSFIASPIVFVMCVVFSIALLLSIISGVTAAGSVGAEINVNIPYEYRSQIPDGFYDAVDIANDIMVFVSNVPSIILTIGMWLMYSSARSSSVMNTTGLTMIRGISIFYLVMMCIVCGIFALCGLVIMYAALISAFELMIGIAFIIIIIGCGLLALFIVFFAKLVVMLGRIRNTLITGVADDRISSFVAVMCFVLAGINFISSLQFILFDFLTFVSGIVTVASMIIFGVLIFSYRSMIKGHIEDIARAQMSYGNQYENNNY